MTPSASIFFGDFPRSQERELLDKPQNFVILLCCRLARSFASGLSASRFSNFAFSLEIVHDIPDEALAHMIFAAQSTLSDSFKTSQNDFCSLFVVQFGHSDLQCTIRLVRRFKWYKIVEC